MKLVGIIDEEDRSNLSKINRPGIKLYGVKQGSLLKGITGRILGPQQFDATEEM